jgi:hypothetical protein
MKTVQDLKPGNFIILNYVKSKVYYLVVDVKLVNMYQKAPLNFSSVSITLLQLSNTSFTVTERIKTQKITEVLPEIYEFTKT